MAQIAAAAGGWQVPDITHRGAYWQHVVLSRVALARVDLNRCDADDPTRDRIDSLLETAQRAAERPGSRLRLWFGGSAVNRAFVNLHAAHVLLARHAPDDQLDVRARSAMMRVRTTMPETAERRRELEKRYDATARAPEGAEDKRWVLENALEWSYATTDAQYARLRSFRTIVSGVSLVVLLFAAALAALGWAWPRTLQLCFGTVCPSGTAPAPRDALVIGILGAAGGALAAVLTVSRMQGTCTPYGVPLALALLKLPFGALTAILGLMLIHGRFIPGLTDLDTSGQILAYAIALGVAQHAVTGLVDRRGQELLDRIPSKPSAAPALYDPGSRRRRAG